MSSRASSFGGTIVVALLVALTAHRATAQTMQPVSRTLHAQASAPPASHNPPDVVVGPVFGPFSHSATASATVSASAEVSTDMTPTFLRMRVSGTVSSSFQGNVPGASGFVTSVFNLPTETTFNLFLYKGGSTSHFSAAGSIREAGGGPIHFQQDAPFAINPPGPPTVLTLPPGQYEARLGGFATTAAGTGGGGGATFDLNVIPEPAGMLALFLAPFVLLPRRR
jgi:hypothetical protein